MSSAMTRYFPTHLLPHEVLPEQVQAPVYHIWRPKQLHGVPLGHLLQQSVAQRGVAMAVAHMNHLETPAQTRWMM
jgi:hypothetical protein